ncbi:MAG: D-serine ammonia-lyase [Tissierellia bacterium]|nr:D-serine ammonia-lyase [Tissierellia bacterium]
MTRHIDLDRLKKTHPLVEDLAQEKVLFWKNPKKLAYEDLARDLPVPLEAIYEAADRLDRFRPFIQAVFPETQPEGGLIESPLRAIPKMGERLKKEAPFLGDLYLKMDSHLAVAGSIKARGGIYEVLKHTEDLAQAHGLLEDGDYLKLASPEAREIFKGYTIQVGSTGNLGLSIGISSAKIGYKVIVHMSQDAKAWKKDLLRSYGVQVVEYASDYSLAVEKGRAESDQDPKSHFVDDENSMDLFLGYAVAALRLRGQLEEENIVVDEAHPLHVYIPCGVGGAPGGVAYGLKALFKDQVHLYFVEPTKAPCMVLGMATGLQDQIAVKDIGLDGKTEADGLAVGRPSGFVGGVMDPVLDGIFTIEDGPLNPLMKALYEAEGIFIEPSAAASFQGVLMNEEARKVLPALGLPGSTHIAWATGGALVPEDIRKEILK